MVNIYAFVVSIHYIIFQLIDLDHGKIMIYMGRFYTKLNYRLAINGEEHGESEMLHGGEARRERDKAGDGRLRDGGGLCGGDVEPRRHGPGG